MSTSALPAWRQNAIPGISLAQARAAATPLKAATKLPSDLARIVRPVAQTRWLLPNTSSVTPDYISNVLRGALSGSHVLQWELFDLMEDTWPRLTKNLNELKRAVIARDWKCEPWAEEDAPPTDTATERSRLVSRAVWTMRPAPDDDGNAFERTLYDLLDAWAKGVSVVELEWESRAAGALGEIIAPRASYWVHPSNYGWNEEGWIGLVNPGLNQPGVFTTKVDIERFPDEKFLIAVCKARSGHPLAGALLRPLAFWWCAANFTAEWFLNFAQIFGLPIRWANYDPNIPNLVDQVCDMLENMGSAAWGAFPAGTTLELKEPMKAGADNPQVALLDRADTQCDILILGQTLTTATPTAGGGTRAQGEVHLSVREDVIQGAADFVAGVINQQLVPMILRLNYGDESEAPEFCPEPKREEDDKANAEVLQIAVTTGLKVPLKFAHDKLGIPLPQADEEIVERAAPANPFGGMPGDPANPDLNLSAALHARSATDKLVDNTLEKLTGVEARWLGGVKPFFHYLIATAQSQHVTNEQFEQVLLKAQNTMPELFDRLDATAVAEALNDAMSAAVVNGAVRGAMVRSGQANRKAVAS